MSDIYKNKLSNKELMVGDLVSNGRIIKVVEPNDIPLCESSILGWFFIGIPITPKILEDNGFLYNNCGCLEWSNWWHEDVPFIIEPCDIEATPYAKKVVSYKLCTENYEGSTDFATIRNIHELQHALRLCGCDIKITINEDKEEEK